MAEPSDEAMELGWHADGLRDPRPPAKSEGNLANWPLLDGCLDRPLTSIVGIEWEGTHMATNALLSIAYTPDSDDAFYYYALESGQVPMPGSFRSSGASTWASSTPPR